MIDYTWNKTTTRADPSWFDILNGKAKICEVCKEPLFPNPKAEIITTDKITGEVRLTGKYLCPKCRDMNNL